MDDREQLAERTVETAGDGLGLRGPVAIECHAQQRAGPRCVERAHGGLVRRAAGAVLEQVAECLADGQCALAIVGREMVAWADQRSLAQPRSEPVEPLELVRARGEIGRVDELANELEPAGRGTWRPRRDARIGCRFHRLIVSSGANRQLWLTGDANLCIVLAS